uniref:F-box domain-containing protein n=1 Tax=Timema shepardi TaxID=629360 RepID=A0A7R9G6Y4_TIMSH|nr:unnamed protein product [Timema shepardi]
MYGEMKSSPMRPGHDGVHMAPSRRLRAHLENSKPPASSPASEYLRNKPLFRASSNLSELWTSSVVTRVNNLGDYDPIACHRRTTRQPLARLTNTNQSSYFWKVYPSSKREKYYSTMTSGEETVGKDIETESRGVVVNHLPNEMLLKIFSLLDVKDICYSTRYVCKRWNVLSNDEALWKNSEFVCTKNMTLEYIYKMLRSASLLRAVVLQWRLDTAGILEVLCKCCPDIQRIQLICCGMINLNTMEMLSVRYPGLLHLSMGKSFSVQRDCFDVLGQFRKIQSINLSHSRLTGDQLESIVDSCPDLVEINIDYVRGIEERYILNLIAAKKETLVSLAVFGDRVTDSTFEALQECNKLYSLHISQCGLLSDRGLKSLSSLKTLSSLKLRYASNISYSGLCKFLLQKTLSSLKYLSLSRSNKFDDVCAVSICQNCASLQELDLSYCPNVTAEGIKTLSQGCKSLKVIYYNVFNPEHSVFMEKIVFKVPVDKKNYAVGTSLKKKNVVDNLKEVSTSR